MAETRRCTKCQRERPLAMFHVHKRDGIQTWCKACMADYRRAYDRRPERRQANRAYLSRPDVKARRARNRIERRLDPLVRGKLDARRFAQTALANGRIDKLPCAGCGAEQSQQHHPDYDHPLLIVWLCRPCHLELHRLVIK